MAKSKSLLNQLIYLVAKVVSQRALAYFDLFIPQFGNKVEWRSGLGEALYTLYGLVRTLRPAAIIEIGSSRGKSTCAMALACRENRKGKVYAIDPHIANYWSDQETANTSFDFLLQRLRIYGLRDWCEVIRKTSGDALKVPPVTKVDFVFIDGDHSYEGVKLDFELCQPLLSEHALVLFHDSTWGYFPDDPNCRPGLGVPKFLDELRQSGYEAVTLFSPPGLTILQPVRGGFPYRVEQSIR
jgi:predicted O-methyltransferase YrrM